MSIDAALAGARQIWGSGLEPTPSNLHAGAVGLAASGTATPRRSRSTRMLRGRGATETWCVTTLGLLPCASLRSEVVSTPENALEVFDELVEDLAAMLPTKKASVTLLDEKGGAPDLAVEWIETNGFGNWLAFLAAGPPYPAHWWGAPAFERIVDQYCELDSRPPDLESFRVRMLTAPWDLSDEQAQFVCDHRYDVR